jgi:molecular chaperone GrpE
MNPQQEALLEQFRIYLEQSAPQGLLPETEDEEIDLFTLFSELSALKNEVKRESRQLKEALARFGELFELLQQNQSRLERALDQGEQVRESAEETCRRTLLLEIVALRDRLLSNLHFVQSHRPGWVQQLDRRERLFRSDLQQGIEITLRNLDHLLESHQVVEVVTEGQLFDPHTMRVEAVENHPGMADSLVLSTLSSGHLLQGEPLRTARVIVNKQQLG